MKKTSPASIHQRRGIILAGGRGTRLYPITLATSKQLLPVYDKPLIYYPLSTIMLAGIKRTLIISTPQDISRYKALLGDGANWGLELEYAVQEKPSGIAESLIIAADFLDGHPSMLVLGDNIHYGQDLTKMLDDAAAKPSGATVFCYRVPDPERYGVVEFDRNGKPTEIVEKPPEPTSHYAVTGLYFYDAEAPAIARALKPSGRNELEITDLNRDYLKRGRLQAVIMRRGMAWFDTGTQSSLLQAAQFIATVEARQGLKIACPEEIAWRRGLIDLQQLEVLADGLRASDYGTYLAELVREVRED